MNKKGFTLIELLAVLVVLAILALISIPITIRIINQARENSYKRSIESYGRAVESYIGDYLLHNDIDYRDIKLSDISSNIHTGNNVTCDNLSFDTKGDIILTGCKTNNSDTYRYKERHAEKIKDTYSIGNTIKVNGIEFYVIKDSPKEDDYVTALKAEPLTTNEVSAYGVDHINNYSGHCKGVVCDENGYGEIAYYTSETCGYINNDYINDGCTSKYDDSDVKYVLEQWKDNKLSSNALKEVQGYKIRLISKEDIIRFGYKYNDAYYRYNVNDDIPTWVYNRNYDYWTMMEGSGTINYVVSNVGSISSSNQYIYSTYHTIRPVINVYKNAID